MSEGQTTHQSVSPYCQFIYDSSEFYSKVSEKWNKYFSSMVQFLTDLSLTEKSIVKQYRDMNLPEKRKPENIYGPFQGSVYEFLRTNDLKERNHITFNKFLEGVLAKIDQLVKTYKYEEKNIIS